MGIPKNKDYHMFDKLMEYTEASCFVRESNRIEGIHREPKKEEINEYLRFMKLDKVTVDDIIQFVGVYQQNAKLRDQYGMDVRVGNHIPMAGGTDVLIRLENILKWAQMEGCEPFGGERYMSAYRVHHAYETLRPFTDCNGRSGRMLWRWMMRDKPLAPLGFLQTWYYQSLEEGR